MLERRRHIASLVLVTASVLSGCDDKNSYAAAEEDLRNWLTAVHEGDGVACVLMTSEYRQEVATPSDDCQQAVVAGDSDALEGLPRADAQMNVSAWDPSGEALVEATDGNEEFGFWMQYEGGEWLVAGPAG